MFLNMSAAYCVHLIYVLYICVLGSHLRSIVEVKQHLLWLTFWFGAFEFDFLIKSLRKLSPLLSGLSVCVLFRRYWVWIPANKQMFWLGRHRELITIALQWWNEVKSPLVSNDSQIPLHLYTNLFILYNYLFIYASYVIQTDFRIYNIYAHTPISNCDL